MRIFLALIITFMALPLFCQMTGGEIIYELKIDLHRNIPDEMSSMKDRIPPYRTSKHSLIFNQSESLFKLAKVQNAEVDASPRGRRRGFGRRNSNTQLYRNLQERNALESTEFFGKKFLIEGETDQYTWKMTGKTKQVGDYLCQQATYQDSSTNLMVWFTPIIPIMAGPANYGGLPGLILYVDINEGERVYTALEINPRDVTDEEINKPTEGDKISREEFNKLKEEKIKEMREEYGGNRRMFFRLGGE